MMKHIILIITTVLCCLGLSAQTDSVFYIQGSVGRLATHLQLPQIETAQKLPIVILCHGFMGCMDGELFDDISSDLVAKGIGVVRFDFNGHGKSDGEFRNMTVPNEIEDAKTVIKWVRTQNLQNNLIARTLSRRSSGGNDRRRTWRHRNQVTCADGPCCRIAR